MREDLIGYLLEALDPAELEMVEARLSHDPQLKRELALFSRGLEPLTADRGHCDPPAGLAHRTCEFIFAHSETVSLAPGVSSSTSRWTMSDLVVAAGIFFAAAMLFFPALNQSRFAARVSGCQNNLQKIGTALANYSTLHKGYFPNVPVEGSLSAAGIYATRLVEQGFLKDPQSLVCPASTLAAGVATFRIPTVQELQTASAEQLSLLHRQMGGSYGYNLGYVSDGSYQSTRNLSRARFALMADAPGGAAPRLSPNHGGCGQNVLFEDLHVQYMTSCKARGCTDDIFLNDEGNVAPGLHKDDAVIGSSPVRPLLAPVGATRPGSR